MNETTITIPVRIRHEQVLREDTTIPVSVPIGADIETIKKLALEELERREAGDYSPASAWEHEEIIAGLGYFVEEIDGQDMPDTEGYYGETERAAKDRAFVEEVAAMDIRFQPSVIDRKKLNRLIEKARELRGTS